MKKAILLASFGVFDEEQRRMCLDSVREDVRKEFCDCDVFEAYTSNFIRKKMEKAGVKMPSLPECLDAVLAEGYEKILVQPLHLTPGEEYGGKIVKPVEDRQKAHAGIHLGTPLFTLREEDSEAFAAAWGALPPEEGEELVFMGHGSPHLHNPVYEHLQGLADAAALPISIGVVEATDTPSFADVLARLRRKGRRRVLLRPLLLAGGVHAQEDMAGEGKHSWLSRLRGEGMAVRADTRGLGSYEVFRKCYLRKIAALIACSYKTDE